MEKSGLQDWRRPSLFAPLSMLEAVAFSQPGRPAKSLYIPTSAASAKSVWAARRPRRRTEFIPFLVLPRPTSRNPFYVGQSTLWSIPVSETS